MQQETNNDEQKFADEEIKTSRFLSVTSANDQEPTLSKSSPWRRSARSLVFNTHSEIKRRDVVSSLPLDNSDDLITIRSIRQHKKPEGDNDKQPSIITINISGDRFQTHLSTLQLYPDTLLGEENKRKHYWNPKTEEYFFDRHRNCFEAILYYYQSNGRLRRPEFVPLDTFFEEISFFELGTEASAQVHLTENVKEIKHSAMPRTLWRRYIWFYMEYPQHSVIARVISLLSMVFTILSCVSLAIESLPTYTDRWNNICKERANISLDSSYTPRCSALFTSPFFIIQTVCVAFFTIEFLLRLISTPSYRQFLISFFNWVDLSAIIPYYVFLAIQLSNRDLGLDTKAILCIRILRVLRFSRLFKLYLVFKRLKSLRVLSATVKESLVDFIVMITILTLLAFLFGAAVYFAEQGVNSDVYDSIPKSIYWGIITITGVGYGDMCPITVAGRILTCLCALFGSATMGMLVSVLVDRYQRVYNRRMYVSEPKITPVDFDMIKNLEDDTNSVSSLQESNERRRLSSVISRRLSPPQEKIKHDQHQSHNLQFIVSFNDNDIDRSATDHIVTEMKNKLSEAISNSDIGVNLKLIDNDNKELWNISSFDSTIISISTRTLSIYSDNSR